MKLHLPKGLKKALLACAAPAAVLIATFAPSAYAYSVYIPYGGDTYAGEHAFVFIIGEETTIDSSNSNLLSYTVGGNATSGAYTWCRYSLNESDDVITLSLLRTQGNGTVDNTYTFSFSEGYTTLQKGVVYTIKNAGAGQGNSVQLLQGGTVIATLTADCRMNAGGSSVTSTFNDTYAVGEFVWKATGTSAALDYTSKNWENNYSSTLLQYGYAVFNASEDLAKTVNVGSKIDVNVISIKDDYTFTGTTDTAEIDARSITIAEGKTLTVDGVALTCGNINDLTRVAGTNGLVLANGTSYLVGGDSEETAVSTQLEGTLVIKSGATLRLGYQGDEEATISTKYIDLSSLEGIELAGGTLASRAFAGDLGDINVTAASTLNFVDINNADTSAVSIGTLTVGDFEGDRDLTLTSKWKSRVEVETLTGAGTVWFTCAGGDGAGRKLTVESVEGFTGKIHIQNHDNNKATLNVTIKDTETLSATQIEASNNSEVVIDGAGTYNLGNSAYLAGYTASGTTTEKGRFANTWTGTAVLKDFTLAGTDLDTYGNAGSTVKLVNSTGTLRAGDIETKVQFGVNGSEAPALKTTGRNADQTFTFTNAVSGNGNFCIESSVPTDGTEDNKYKADTYKFTGDTSAWTGKLIAGNNTHTNVEFDGTTAINNEIDATNGATMNASIVNNSGVTVSKQVNQNFGDSAGTINLTVSNKTTESTGSVTFADVVNVSKATLGENVSAVFNSASTLGTLTLNAGASVTGAGPLTISNLVMSDGSSIAANEAITLGGLLSINGVVTLDGGLLDGLSSLTASDTLTLFTGVSTLALNDTEYSTVTRNLLGETRNLLGEEDLATYFTGVESGQFYLGYDANGTVYAGKVVPEPTTATLSLLALAGLAARRRRK